MITIHDFRNDEQGHLFADVIESKEVDFQKVIDFFNDEKILLRMEDSERHHDRPPLAGCIKEFEQLQTVTEFLSKTDAHKTVRFRQAIGVLVKLHMLKRGWRTKGRKGSLGSRDKAKMAKGVYENEHGLSRWFLTAERYDEVLPHKR